MSKKSLSRNPVVHSLSTDFLKDFTISASYSIMSSQIIFGSTVIYSEHLENHGSEIDIKHDIIIRSSSVFSSNVFITSIIDSFEFYLENIVRHLLSEKPELMLGKDSLLETTKSSVSFESLVKALLSNELDTNFVVEKYTARFKSGPAYLNFIRFIEGALVQKVIPKDDISKLDWIFRLRNQITHEGGKIKASKLGNSPFDSFENQGEAIPKIALFEISHFLLLQGYRIEEHLRNKFKDLSGFNNEFQGLFDLLGESADLADDCIKVLDGEKGYFRKAVERASNRN